MIENRLGAIAVMQVDIENRNLLVFLQQVVCGNDRIVQIAESTGDIGSGVMAGRSCQGVRHRIARHHDLAGMDSGPGAGD